MGIGSFGKKMASLWGKIKKAAPGIINKAGKYAKKAVEIFDKVKPHAEKALSTVDAWNTARGGGKGHDTIRKITNFGGQALREAERGRNFINNAASQINRMGGRF